MAQDAKSTERQRLAAALRANLRRRKAAAAPLVRAEAAEPDWRTVSPEAAADGESKG